MTPSSVLPSVGGLLSIWMITRSGRFGTSGNHSSVSKLTLKNLRLQMFIHPFNSERDAMRAVTIFACDDDNAVFVLWGVCLLCQVCSWTRVKLWISSCVDSDCDMDLYTLAAQFMSFNVHYLRSGRDGVHLKLEGAHYLAEGRFLARLA